MKKFFKTILFIALCAAILLGALAIIVPDVFQSSDEDGETAVLDPNDPGAPGHTHVWTDYRNSELIHIPANCTEKEQRKSYCLFCNEFIILEGSSGECEYAYEYYNSAEHTCFCVHCYIDWKENHSFEYNQDTDKYHCVCGHSYTEGTLPVVE